MSLPEQIMKSAILGTARQSFNSDADSESQLLIAAVRSTLRQKAGYVPGYSALPLSERCDSDSTQPCSESAMHYLRLLLMGIHGDALTEWLIEAYRAGVHVQAELLPKLLLLGQNQPALRPYLAPVLGQRG